MKRAGLGLKAQLEAEKNAAPAPSGKEGKASGREGKTAVIGYFSPELTRTLGRMRVDEGTTLQALLGEAIDLLLASRGKHPFGER